MPLVFAITSILPVESNTEFEFALVPQEKRRNSENIDFNSLEYKSDLTDLEIPFNGMIVSRCIVSPRWLQTTRARMSIIPYDTHPFEDYYLSDRYEVYTDVVKGPAVNKTLLAKVKLDEYELTPGKYKIQMYSTITSGFTLRASESKFYDLTLKKDNLTINSSEPFNLNGVKYGVIYTFERENYWTVVYNGKVLNSLNEGVQVRLNLYLEKNNKYEKIKTLNSENDGTFYYEYNVTGSFEQNAMAKITTENDNRFYNPAEHEEYAGLEFSAEGGRFFSDENGDGYPDWPYSFSDLLNALKTSDSPPPDPLLSFNARFEEGSGLETYDSASGIKGNIIGNASWAQGKFGSGISLASTRSKAFVKSIEHIEMEIGRRSRKKSALLTKNQNISNCVPFATKKISQFTYDDWDDIALDIYFEPGPAVTIERSKKRGGLTVSIYVIEFDPKKVEVQQGIMDFSEKSYAAPVNPVNLNKTAMIFYYQHQYYIDCPWLPFLRWLPFPKCDDWASLMLMGSFENNNTLRWEREKSTGQIKGHYYLFEAKHEEFSVQRTKIHLEGITNVSSIYPVNASRSFVISSYKCTTPNDNSNSGTVDVWLKNSATLKAERYSSAYAATVNAFVVELTGKNRVQRGVIEYPSLIGNAIASINPVTIEKATINSPVIGGQIRASDKGSFDVMRAWHKLSFANNDTIEGDISYFCIFSDNEATGHFEVIEWETTKKIESAYIDFGDTLNDVLGKNSNDFSISAWIKPYKLTGSASKHGIQNCFIAKAGDNSADNLELGVTPDGKLSVYIGADAIDFSAEYGANNSVRLNEWNAIALRYDDGNVDACINGEWFDYDVRGEEPWINASNLDNAAGSSFTIGITQDSRKGFSGSIDEISVFREAMSRLEIENSLRYNALQVRAVVSRENAGGGWTPIESEELIHNYINFECRKISSLKIISSLKFFVTNFYPDIAGIYDNNINLSLIKTFSEDRQYYSYVLDSRKLPDDAWYFIVKANDTQGNTTFDVYDISDAFARFRVRHFEESVNFNYLHIGGRINTYSPIAIVPLNDFEQYIRTMDIYGIHGNDVVHLNAEPIDYYDIVEDDNLIYLYKYMTMNTTIPGENIININITLHLDYGAEFLTYSYNYSVGPIVLDNESPDIVITDLKAEGSALTAKVRYNASDLDHIELAYKYATGGEWIYYGEYSGYESPLNISFDMEHLRDGEIDLRITAYDDLLNSRPEHIIIRKDFNNHLDFAIEGLDYIYSLDQNNMIDIAPVVYPYDNDITKVIASTSYESFELTLKEVEDDHIYFTDMEQDIKLNSSFYGVAGGKFTRIPINFELYQNQELISSKKIAITATSAVFENIKISNIEVDFNSSLPENVWMSFANLTGAYNNSHGIPFVANNKAPLVHLYNSEGILAKTVTLEPHIDDEREKVYDQGDIEIGNGKLELSIPDLAFGEEICSVGDVIIKGKSRNFSYYVGDNYIFITLLSGENLDGLYGLFNPITLKYGISNATRIDRQFTGYLDFNSLKEGEYLIKGEFYDISGAISYFTINRTFIIEGDGPKIYAQFENGRSVNPKTGSIEFIINDLSGVANVFFNTTIRGNWIIDGNLYTFNFNDTNIKDGL
ncbi:MAG: LamG domain-containing protein, partial [Candidatus Helarchaeota archaeon]